MNNKKAQGLSITVILLISLIFLGFMILIIVGTYAPCYFHPEDTENCVCEEYKSLGFSSKLYANDWQKENCDKMPEKDGMFECLDCSSYTKKSFCEKCADKGYIPYPLTAQPKETKEIAKCNEECKCEEYEDVKRECIKKVMFNLSAYNFDTDKRTYFEANLTGNGTCISEKEIEDELLSKFIIELGYSRIGVLSRGEKINYITEQGKYLKATERTKPIEINLRKEKCVQFANDIILGNKFTTLPSIEPFTCGDYEKLITSTEESRNYQKMCCIRKEPLTECEKGNELYVEDCVEYAQTCHDYNVTSGKCEPIRGGGPFATQLCYKFTITQQNCSNTDICQKTGCRRRTIYDLTCEDLQNVLLDKLWICYDDKSNEIYETELICPRSILSKNPNIIIFLIQQKHCFN